MPDNGVLSKGKVETVMPIRFRCAYCNQLMGIARRKAGSVIRCPKCAGDIIVPTPEDGPELPEGSPDRPLNLTFEDNRLEKLLEPCATQPAAGEAPDATAAHVLGGASTFVPQALHGLYLPRGMLVVAIVITLVLLAMAFGAGVLAGRLWFA
jgi:DNA-directed RNA polymerase subunit RPC12/RpoP